MKVLFVASDNNKMSGAFLSMVALNKILKEKFNVETCVIVPKMGNGVELLDDIGVSHIYVKNWDWVVNQEQKETFLVYLKRIAKRVLNKNAVCKISKIIKTGKYDIVHLNTSYPYVAAEAAKKCKVPYIWHLREFLEEDQGRKIWNKRKGYRLISDSSAVIAISTTVYDKYKKLLPNANLVKILNGIDTQKFYIPEHTIFSNEENIINMIYGGGYSVRKGVFSLVSAIKLVVDMGITNFKLSFIGEPNIKFKRAVTKYELDDYVEYLGFQPNVNLFYEKSDIAFSTSKCEAFGRKTVEAMLAGCLIISSDTGGSLDIIEDGKTGLFYNEGNPIDLALKIIYAFKHPEEARKMAEAGREYAKENLSADTNADKIRLLYEGILKDE